MPRPSVRYQLRRRVEGGVFYARFCRDGVAVERSTGERDRSLAEAAAGRFFLEASGSEPTPGQPETVYFIAAERLHLVKIGRASNVSARLRQLRQIIPLRLALLGTVPGGAAVEAALHRRFAHLREHGEWFRAGEDLLDVVQAAGGGS
jgi:hypothetical protein